MTESGFNFPPDLSGLPFLPLEFSKEATPVSSDPLQALNSFLTREKPTDLIVLSHGWNNDKREALDLYTRYAVSFIREYGKLDPVLRERHRFAMAGVFWPSKKFADKDLIPGGAASAGSRLAEELPKTLDDLRGVFDAGDADASLERLAELLPELEQSAAQEEFLVRLRNLVPSSTKEELDGSNLFFDLDAATVMERLSQPVSDPDAVAAGGAAGFMSGQGVLAAARNAINLVTYYQMKERARLVGIKGLNPLLQKIRATHPDLRLHLVGHSFGGLLVTATVAGKDPASLLKVNSLSLLQAAYSHYGLASEWDGSQDGTYRRVAADGVDDGPILITHSRNDRAVGIAYPLASLLARQVGQGLGDATDKYGGIGRNGALKTPEAKDNDLLLRDSRWNYRFLPGNVYNLQGDDFIADHGDVTGAEVAWATLYGMVVEEA